jgi:hypothetical protein
MRFQPFSVHFAATRCARAEIYCIGKHANAVRWVAVQKNFRKMAKTTPIKALHKKQVKPLDL